MYLHTVAVMQAGDEYMHSNLGLGAHEEYTPMYVHIFTDVHA